MDQTKSEAWQPTEDMASWWELINSNLVISHANIKDCISILTADCHMAAVEAGWWNDIHTGEDLHGKRNIAEMLMLTVSELAEAMEGYRKNKPDDHLPHRSMLEVELADALIRIFDLAGSLGLDLAGAYIEKRKYNDSRTDHKPENRRGKEGKRF